MHLRLTDNSQNVIWILRALFFSWFVDAAVGNGNQTSKIQCRNLLMGQYHCDEPKIDHYTQQASGCKEESRTVSVLCYVAPEIECIPDESVKGLEKAVGGHRVFAGFRKDVSCKWTNGYDFETALLLSVFLGMFGIDRFYLGFPAIGLLKFSTLGFFFLGQLIDVLLIATQIVKPSDGSDYIINFYGAGLERLYMNNETIVKIF